MQAVKLRKSPDKWLSQPWCSHSNTIRDVQLQKTKDKRQEYYECSRGAQQPGCSHYNAICTDWVAKRKRFPSIPSVQALKTKLSWETSFKFQLVKLWTWSFPATLPSNSTCWRCENEAFAGDFLQILTVEIVKVALEPAVPLHDRSDHDPGRTERVPKTVRITSFPTHHPRHV